MSDRDFENSRISYLKKLDKYMEAGISVYSLKTNESNDQLKPIKKQSGNILEELRREIKFKNKLIKIKKKKKLLTNFNKTAKDEYKNFLILNREKKFKSYFHETESKSKKYCSHSSQKEIEEIKTVMFVNPLENREMLMNNKDRNSGSKSQKGKKLIKDNMFITNLDKPKKINGNQDKREYLNNDEEKIHKINKEKNTIENNIKNTNGNNSFENVKYNENTNSYEEIEKYHNHSKNINQNPDFQIINNLKKVDVFEKNKKCVRKKSLILSKNLLDNSIEINQSCLLPKENLEQNIDSSILKNNKGKIIISNNDINLLENNNIISTLNFYPVCNKLYKNAKTIDDNFSKNKNLQILKSPTYDPDFHLLNPERIQQEKNTSMNFNKNPGLIKRANLRFSCIDFNTILINKSENDFNKLNEEYKNHQSDYNTLNNSIKLPELKNSLNFHRKNYSQIPVVNFLDSFNKFKNSKSKEILINKNIIFNSATDLQSKLSKVKSMEKTELFKRSFNKVNLIKEKNYSTYNKHNGINYLKFKNNTDGYLFKDSNAYDYSKNNNIFNNLKCSYYNNFYPNNYQNLNNNNFYNNDYNNIYDFNNGTYYNNETNQIDEENNNNFSTENYNNIMINQNYNYNNIENLTSNEKSFYNITNEEKKKELSDSNSNKKFKNIKKRNEFNSSTDINRRFEENNNFSVFSKIKNVKMNLQRNIINENILKDSLKTIKLENSNRNSSLNNYPQIEAGSFSLPKTIKKYSKGYRPINNIIYNDEKGPYLIDLYNRKKL